MKEMIKSATKRINVHISARFNNYICVLDATFYKEDNCKENRIFFLNKCQLVQMCVDLVS